MTSADPRLLGALGKTLLGGVDETHLSVFHAASNHAHGKRSRRDCTTFTSHDLADFYIESMTAHRMEGLMAIL